MSIATLKEWLSENTPGLYLTDEPLSKHTSFRIGGPADLFFVPRKVVQIVHLLSAAREHGVPVTIMGNGSNLLVLDKGVSGLVIKVGNALKQVRREGNLLIAEAGVSLAAIAMRAHEEGLTGLEFAVGIPGSLGGAVFMNAGAYGGEMCQVVKAVTIIDCNDNFTVLDAEELEFGYRTSSLQGMKCVLTEVVLELAEGDKAEIKTKMNDYTGRRNSKQPLDMPSAGSTFKRPVGYFAGTLIEQAGLKGFSVGGASVSQKHAGFVVNSGGATAADVLELIHQVQERVFAMSGVCLQPEIKVIGKE